MVAEFCGYAVAEPGDRLMEGKKKASSDIKRRNFLVRSMPISAKSLSGPRLFIFQACELMGGSRRCSKLLITPIKFGNLGDFSQLPPSSPTAVLPTPPLLIDVPCRHPPRPTTHPTVALQSGGQWTCCEWPSFGYAWLPWTHSSHTYTHIHAHKWGHATLGLTLIWVWVARPHSVWPLPSVPPPYWSPAGTDGERSPFTAVRSAN